MIQYISNNGSGRDLLVSSRMNVANKLREAIDLMSRMAPHGRDYVAPDGTYEADREAYWAKRDTLIGIMNAIEAEAVALHSLPGGF